MHLIINEHPHSHRFHSTFLLLSFFFFLAFFASCFRLRFETDANVFETLPREKKQETIIKNTRPQLDDDDDDDDDDDMDDEDDSDSDPFEDEPFAEYPSDEDDV